MLRRTGMDRYEGYVVNRPTFRRPKPLQVFFAITLSCPATIKVAGQESALVDEISGEGVVAVFELGKVAAPVELRVALSYTSTVGAWRNLDAEVTGHSFDAIRDQARATWNRELSVIHVEGGTEEQRARFYTDLFHALAGTSRDIVEIAMDCGFQSLSGFYHSFHSCHGLTPRQYRQNASGFLNSFGKAEVKSCLKQQSASSRLEKPGSATCLNLGSVL